MFQTYTMKNYGMAFPLCFIDISMTFIVESALADTSQLLCSFMPDINDWCPTRVCL
jgi:hypothetical protein